MELWISGSITSMCVVYSSKIVSINTVIALHYNKDTAPCVKVPYSTVPYSTERTQSYSDAREDRTMHFLYPKINTCIFKDYVYSSRLFLSLDQSKRMHVYFEKVEMINVSG